MTAPLPERIAAAIADYRERCRTLDEADCYGSMDRASYDEQRRGMLDARAELVAAISDVVAERDSWMHSANVKANEAQQLRAERDAERARADGLAAELAKLHARIEQSHNGYSETGKSLGMERPASHLIALGELLTEQVELADSVVRMERDEARADLAAAQAKLAEVEKERAYYKLVSEGWTEDEARGDVWPNAAEQGGA